MTAAEPYPILFWDDVAVGDVVPSIVILITRYKTALIPAVTLDGFPGHFSGSFAKKRGLKTVFMNTMPLLGIFNRFGTDWAGPRAFIAGQHIHMIRPVYAGDILTVSGKVTKCRERTTPAGVMQAIVEIEAEIHGADGELLVKGGVSLALPRRQ